MKLSPQSHGGRRRAARLLGLVSAWLAASFPPPAVAHDLYSDCIQHRVRLSIGDRRLDVTFDLTFFEDWSAKERLAMDADGNGRISRSELDEYTRKLGIRIARQVRLRVAGRELALAPLYEPEADLLGHDQPVPAHHRLRLHFFAASPPVLRPGDEIEVEDALWPKARALVLLEAEGTDGAALEVKNTGDPVSEPARPDAPRTFKFRCVKPPALTPSPSP